MYSNLQGNTNLELLEPFALKWLSSLKNVYDVACFIHVAFG
jgi:hypothetical protein